MDLRVIVIICSHALLAAIYLQILSQYQLEQF